MFLLGLRPLACKRIALGLHIFPFFSKCNAHDSHVHRNVNFFTCIKYFLFIVIVILSLHWKCNLANFPNVELIKHFSFSYVRVSKLVPKGVQGHVSRQTWSERPSPVLRPPSQFGVQVTFGVFNLERSRVLHWWGQSLYRQTQQSG